MGDSLFSLVYRDCDIFLCFFFFQAEDGIRDVAVTGVQTCALPISEAWSTLRTRAAATIERNLRAMEFAMTGPLLTGSDGGLRRSFGDCRASLERLRRVPPRRGRETPCNSCWLLSLARWARSRATASRVSCTFARAALSPTARCSSI